MVILGISLLQMLAAQRTFTCPAPTGFPSPYTEYPRFHKELPLVLILPHCCPIGPKPSQRSSMIRRAFRAIRYAKPPKSRPSLRAAKDSSRHGLCPIPRHSQSWECAALSGPSRACSSRGRPESADRRSMGLCLRVACAQANQPAAFCTALVRHRGTSWGQRHWAAPAAPALPSENAMRSLWHSSLQTPPDGAPVRAAHRMFVQHQRMDTAYGCGKAETMSNWDPRGCAVPMATARLSTGSYKASGLLGVGIAWRHAYPLAAHRPHRLHEARAMSTTRGSSGYCRPRATATIDHQGKPFKDTALRADCPRIQVQCNRTGHTNHAREDAREAYCRCRRCLYDHGRAALGCPRRRLRHFHVFHIEGHTAYPSLRSIPAYPSA